MQNVESNIVYVVSPAVRSRRPACGSLAIEVAQSDADGRESFAVCPL
jgi:hypothetical protein